MIATKEQIADIIQLSKVMIDNHPEEVEGNPLTVALIKKLATVDDVKNLIIK